MSSNQKVFIHATLSKDPETLAKSVEIRLLDLEFKIDEPQRTDFKLSIVEAIHLRDALAGIDLAIDRSPVEILRDLDRLDMMEGADPRLIQIVREIARGMECRKRAEDSDSPKERQMFMETLRIEPGEDLVHLSIMDYVDGERPEVDGETIDFTVPLSQFEPLIDDFLEAFGSKAYRRHCAREARRIARSGN